MARLLTIENCTVGLRNSLIRSLGSGDEAILLPQASQSTESGVFKNIVFRLSGTCPVNPSIFSPEWFTGVSIVKLRGTDVGRIQELLATKEMRQHALKAMAESIKSEVADPEIEVGPSLEADDMERDIENTSWQHGFDSTNSFCGIYSADHSKVVDGGRKGMQRVHKDYFLVCRAGAGVGASTFHSRLLASLSKGGTLDAALETDVSAPGPRALRRLTHAGARNRARIMLDVVNCLELKDVPHVGDQAARNKCRGVVSDIDTVSNSIRKLDEGPTPTWQYSACIDGAFSKGLVSISNQADGLVLFVASNGDTKITLKNEIWGCLPFTSTRILDSRSIVDNLLSTNSAVHPDLDWVKQRFSWKNRTFSDGQRDIEPFGLWGGYDAENFVQSFSRELGIAAYSAVRLRPELVCSAGVDSGKLRAIIKSLNPSSS